MDFDLKNIYISLNVAQVRPNDFFYAHAVKLQYMGTLPWEYFDEETQTTCIIKKHFYKNSDGFFQEIDVNYKCKVDIESLDQLRWYLNAQKFSNEEKEFSVRFGNIFLNFKTTTAELLKIFLEKISTIVVLEDELD